VTERPDASAAGAVTAPPQDGQKRTPAYNGFPQRVQNWAMAAPSKPRVIVQQTYNLVSRKLPFKYGNATISAYLNAILSIARSLVTVMLAWTYGRYVRFCGQLGG
jgi:hypothetical protein